MKQEIRVLGIDDASFDKQDNEVLLVAPFFRGGRLMDGLLSTKVERDGDDATVKIIEMINSSKFRPQLQAILLDGIAFGGFNVVNIESITKNTAIPVITIIRKYPDFVAIKATLKKLDMEKKYPLMELAGEPQKAGLKNAEIWFQYAGCTKETAEEVIKVTTIHGNIPEPLRIAHIIGQGIILGESSGGA